MKQFFVTSIFAILYIPLILTINASPHSFKEKQPDGSLVELRVAGDIDNHQLITTNGYIVMKNSANWIVYAERDESTAKITSSNTIVRKDGPIAFSSIDKRIGVPIKNRAPTRKRRRRKKFNSNGKLKNLVIRIKFSDHLNRELPTHYQYNALFNSFGGDKDFAPSGSIKDFFFDNSYRRLTLDSAIYPWIHLPKSEAYYSRGFTSEAINYALNALDSNQYISFSDFDLNRDNVVDSLTILHSGYGAEWGATDCYGQHFENRIWSQQSSFAWKSKSGISVDNYAIAAGLWGTCGSEIGRLGVIAHELGHAFGLPDLYYSTGGLGAGSYDIMSNCWGFDGSQLFPPNFSAWSKMQLKWISPRVITESGVYEIPAAIKRPVVFIIQEGFPSGEYLLIENRQPLKFDSKMPQGGLAIWHIDENAAMSTGGFVGQTNWPRNGNHYRIALLQADGSYHLEKGHNYGDAGDLWHANGNAYLGSSKSMLGPYPNTDAYQNGMILRTGIEISEISISSIIMSFRVTL